MTVHDRLRATTEEIGATMSPIRPLTLPPATAPAPARHRRSRGSRGPRRSRGPRGLLPWLVPSAAAVAVIAVAVSLVVVRDLPGGPRNGSPGAPAGLPRYVAWIPMHGGIANERQNLVVADTHTGRQLFKAIAPAGQAYTGVAGSADDRTFVADLKSTDGQGPGNHTFFVLHITPGAARPVTATALRGLVLPASTQVLGFAVSPDARTLAMMLQPDAATTPGPATLRTYSLATGKALRTWTGKPASTTPGNRGLYLVDSEAMVSWLDDGKTLAFRSVYLTKTATVFLLDTTRPGHSLLDDSRPVFTQANCGNVAITPDGRTVFCPVPGGKSGSPDPGFVTYSTATGKREQLIYSSIMDPAGSATLWAGSATMAVVIMVDVPVTSPKGRHSEDILIGVITPGKFTPLRINLGIVPVALQGTMAF